MLLLHPARPAKNWKTMSREGRLPQGGPPGGAGGPASHKRLDALELPPILGPASRFSFGLFNPSSHQQQQHQRPSLPAPSTLPIHPRPPQPFSPTAITAMSQLPPPPPLPLSQPQYFTQSGQPIHPPPHMTMSHDPNAPMRYAIPNDGRMLSGGRHKKEIKRRTKTGCLTCRKRRIKVRDQRRSNSLSSVVVIESWQCLTTAITRISVFV